MTKQTTNPGPERESFPIASSEGADEYLQRMAITAHTPLDDREPAAAVDDETPRQEG